MTRSAISPRFATKTLSINGTRARYHAVGYDGDVQRIALLLLFAACSKGASPPPPTPAPPAPPPPADAALVPTMDATITATPMTAASLIAELLDMSKAGMPTAVQLRQRLEPRATSLKLSGPNLDIPNWARSTAGADDVFMEMAGDVIGVRLEEDSRGWGAYAELFVKNTTLAHVEKVTGTTKFVPRNPDDFHSGETRAAYVDRNGKNVRIFVELTKDGKGVQRVLMHFEK
jgi:hypothetical protein